MVYQRCNRNFNEISPTYCCQRKPNITISRPLSWWRRENLSISPCLFWVKILVDGFLWMVYLGLWWRLVGYIDFKAGCMLVFFWLLVSIADIFREDWFYNVQVLQRRYRTPSITPIYGLHSATTIFPFCMVKWNWPT